MSGWTWLGLVAFVATVIAALLVLWRWPFKFAVRSTALVGWMENQLADLDTMTRDLALWSDNARTHASAHGSAVDRLQGRGRVASHRNRRPCVGPERTLTMPENPSRSRSRRSSHRSRRCRIPSTSASNVDRRPLAGRDHSRWSRVGPSQ